MRRAAKPCSGEDKERGMVVVMIKIRARRENMSVDDAMVCFFVWRSKT